MTAVDASILSGVLRRACSEGFSFTSHLLRRKKVNNCCGADDWIPDPDYNAAKAAIAAMGPEDVSRFLRLIGATSARVVYTVNGKTFEKILA
jgi:hypothetical protein